MAIEDLPKPIIDDIIRRTTWRKTNRDNSFGVTELIGCLRKTYWNRTDRLDGTLSQLWYMYRGTITDDAFSKILEEAHVRVQGRVTHRLRNGVGINITGKWDFEDPKDGAIADWKTIGDLGVIASKGAKSDHLIQVMFYAWCENKRLAHLYYIHPQNVIKTDHEFTDNQLLENIEMLEERAFTLSAYLEANRLPDRDDDHHEKFWECKYRTRQGEEYKCPYYERCYPKQQTTLA